MTRQAFESQIRKQFPTANEELLLGRSSSKRYGSMVTEHAWLSWQAATDAALERAAEVCETILDELSFANAYECANECAEAIRALKESKE